MCYMHTSKYVTFSVGFPFSTSSLLTCYVKPNLYIHFPGQNAIWKKSPIISLYINYTGEDKEMDYRATRLIHTSFWLVSLVIVTMYSGNLVAALATQNVKYPFTNVNELAQDNQYKITARAGGAHINFLQVSGVHNVF